MLRGIERLPLCFYVDFYSVFIYFLFLFDIFMFNDASKNIYTLKRAVATLRKGEKLNAFCNFIGCNLCSILFGMTCRYDVLAWYDL